MYITQTSSSKQQEGGEDAEDGGVARVPVAEHLGGEYDHFYHDGHNWWGGDTENMIISIMMDTTGGEVTQRI